MSLLVQILMMVTKCAGFRSMGNQGSVGSLGGTKRANISRQLHNSSMISGPSRGPSNSEWGGATTKYNSNYTER